MSDEPRIRLLSKRLVAVGTMAFEFTQPPGFDFVAGQYAEFSLIDPPETDEEGDSRVFSLASAPAEENLLIATRLRDTAFKRVLRGLPEGAEVLMDGPFGTFTLPSDPAVPVVFLTGGIGVTPIRSIVQQSVADGSERAITVFYANNHLQDAAFLDELQDAAATGRVTLVPTLADPPTSGPAWAGETGHIDAAMLERHLDSLDGPIFFICGPAGMLDAMQAMLRDAGVVSRHLRTEEFEGY